jgi:hypothetical protein
MPRSTGHLVPRAKTTPPILGFHPMKTLHPRTSPCHMCPPQAPLAGNTQVASLARLIPKTHCRILLGRLDPHHTPKTRDKISPSSLFSYYQVISTSCLNHSRHSFTKHHIIDIIRSKHKIEVICEHLAYQRVCRSNGCNKVMAHKQFYQATYHSFSCIKVKR